MKKYKSFLGLLVVFLVILFCFYFYEKSSSNKNINSQNENVGVLPDFIMADVVSLEGQTITLTAGSTQTIALLDSTTVFTQQIKEGNAYKNIPASISDIKVGQRVVVFYKVDGEGQYLADKVQILNF
ncbi:MAG: hypothetical protein V4690_02265 [Patescibacteria group bacterium]